MTAYVPGGGAVRVSCREMSGVRNMRHAELLRCVIHGDVNGLLILGIFDLRVRGCRVPEMHAELPIIIIVGVALETVRQLESQLMMRNYKGFLE